LLELDHAIFRKEKADLEVDPQRLAIFDKEGHLSDKLLED
jgi:hypothetical protein